MDLVNIIENNNDGPKPWLIFKGDSENSLNNFLNDNKPTKITDDICNWILVENKNITNWIEPNILPETEFENLLNSKHYITTLDINNIAIRCNFLLGKWLIYLNSD
jgi:hypothetical protein